MTLPYWELEYPHAHIGSYYQNAYVILCPSFAEDVRSSFTKPRRPLETERVADTLQEREHEDNYDNKYKRKTRRSVISYLLSTEPTAFLIDHQTEEGIHITLEARRPYGVRSKPLSTPPYQGGLATRRMGLDLARKGVF